MISRRLMYCLPHNGTRFRYSKIKKIARVPPSKSRFIGDYPSSPNQSSCPSTTLPVYPSMEESIHLKMRLNGDSPPYFPFYFFGFLCKATELQPKLRIKKSTRRHQLQTSTAYTYFRRSINSSILFTITLNPRLFPV